MVPAKREFRAIPMQMPLGKLMEYPIMSAFDQAEE
jgi:hypothetical protein